MGNKKNNPSQYQLGMFKSWYLPVQHSFLNSPSPFFWFFWFFWGMGWGSELRAFSIFQYWKFGEFFPPKISKIIQICNGKVGMVQGMKP